MRRSVLADQTGTVEAQHNGQIEQGGIVDHIVVSTLRKGRIYVTERNGPLLSHTGGEGNGMTLGNANVESTVGHLAHQNIHGATRGHGRRNADNLTVLAAKFQQRFTENILEAHLGFGIFCRTKSALFVELAGRMPNSGFLLGRLEAFAFHGVQMQEFRAFHLLNFAEHAHQFYHVVPVGRTEIADIHTLKDILLIGQKGFEGIVEAENGAAAALVEQSPVGQLARNGKAESIVRAARVQMHQIVVHTADGAVDAHIVVIENNQQIVGDFGGIVQSLKRQPATHRAVADYGHHLTLRPFFKGHQRHAECCRNRVGSVAAGKCVVCALLGCREGAKAVELAVRGKGIASPRQNLMTIGLMPNVPNYAVFRSIKNIMECHSEFHRAET